MLNRLLRLIFSFSAAASIASFSLGVALWPGVALAITSPPPPPPFTCGCACATGSTCTGFATSTGPFGAFVCNGTCAGYCGYLSLYGDCDATCGCKASKVTTGPPGALAITFWVCSCA